MSYNAILIVEDDNDLANNLQKSFAKRGFIAYAVNSFSATCDIVKKIFFTHAVVDLKINQDSGLEVIKFLNNQQPNIKIVVLTGYASITTTIMAIKCGACYYLAKPSNVDDILLAFDSNIETKINNCKTTSLQNIEQEHIYSALLANNFNISKTAQLLKMHRRTLSRKINKYNLPIS